MTTTRPGYIWSGTEWVAIGQEAAVAPVSYQATEPISPATGDIWIDSDDEVPGITSSLNYRWRKIATGGETSLSGNDSSGLPLAYNPGYEQVYLNGVLLYRGSDYVATTGNTITGLTALVANDTIEVLSFVTAPIGDTYTQSAADARFVNKNVGGLNLVIPTGATGGTVSANGAVTIGSGVSTVSVTGAFSATYDNYKIVLTGGVTSTSEAINFQLGPTSVSQYNNQYYQNIIYTNFAGAAPAAAFTSNGTFFPFNIYSFGANGYNASFEVFSPFKTTYTEVQGLRGGIAGGANVGPAIGFHNSLNSFSGFQLITSAGTMTGGTIRIYGYNNGA
jgi:hypothetical protein